MQISEPSAKKQLISLTSLIDVVFILLVFFMLTSSFVRWNYIELGTSNSDGNSSDSLVQSTIHIGFNQAYLLNGNSVSLDLILIHIQEQISLDNKHPILIQPVDDLPLQELVLVLDSIGEIAAKNISLIKEDS